MKKILFTALSLLPILTLAQKSTFKLNVKMKPIPVKIYAYIHYDVKGNTKFDSVEVVNGSFTFSGELPEPASAQLLVDHAGIGLTATINKNVVRKEGKSDVLNFYLENGEINVVAQDSVKNGIIKSPTDINGRFKKFNEIHGAYVKALAEVTKQYQEATEEQKADTAGFLKNLYALDKEAYMKREGLSIGYIKANPSSWFSLTAVDEMAGNDIDVAKIEPLYKLLSPELKKSYTGATLGQRIDIAKSLKIGQIAPEFTQNDTSGVAVSLSQFRGKYLLIDFWASWCGPCRQENPNFVKVYEDYKTKNFTILSVSLDSRKNDWIAAIKKDGLSNWTHVADLGGYNNAVAKQYNISAIPQNILLDPSGKIIGKNLIGEDLRRKLAEVITAKSK